MMIDYAAKLHETRAKTEASEWKWLRENEARFFNPRLNTSLKTYLEAIFPGEEFVMEQVMNS